MSLLLTDGQFARARDAFSGGEVTGELYAWLGRLVAVAQATRALAPAPVPSGRWDDADAVIETVQAWLEESLLRGSLQQAFDSCASPRALSRYLERALRNWLIARSRRASGPRLLERAAELMVADQEFALVRDAVALTQRWWGLPAWEAPGLYSGGDDEVVSAAWSLGDFALLRYPSSERSDPVLSTPDLRRFLQGLLKQVGRCLSGQHFDLALRARFHYAYAPGYVDLDDAPELASAGSPEATVQLRDAARVGLAALSRRQLLVLQQRPATTLEDLARRLEVSRGTVDNEYRRAILKIREASPSDADFDEVLENVIEMASERQSDE